MSLKSMLAFVGASLIVIIKAFLSGKKSEQKQQQKQEIKDVRQIFARIVARQNDSDSTIDKRLLDSSRKGGS